jgi:hypothetical protein
MIMMHTCIFISWKEITIREKLIEMWCLIMISLRANDLLLVLCRFSSGSTNKENEWAELVYDFT